VTVAELLSELVKLPPDRRVYVACEGDMGTVSEELANVSQASNGVWLEGETVVEWSSP